MVDHDLRTLDAIVEAYKQDQRRIRGLRETTLQSYEQVIRPFLRTTLGEDPLDLTRLMPPDSAGDIRQCITRVRPRLLNLADYIDIYQG